MKKLSEIKWVPLEGEWDIEKNILRFKGGEFQSKIEQTNSELVETSGDTVGFVRGGIVLFDQMLKDGIVRATVSFDDVDERSCGLILLQYNTLTGDHMSFGVTGGYRGFTAENTGYMYKLRTYGNPLEVQQSNISANRSRGWSELFNAGTGYQLKKNEKYSIEVECSSSVIIMRVNGVQIGRTVLPTPSLPGFQCGLFVANRADVLFSDIEFDLKRQKVFVAMQFETPDYESLYANVIKPVCESEGYLPYRADSTSMPGLIIEDIKKQINESYIVIAEISTNNPNVYYEIGYADALGKPVVLISDRSNVTKPFDVRAYRTIFYENTINGKEKVESDLRNFLRSIAHKN